MVLISFCFLFLSRSCGHTESLLIICLFLKPSESAAVLTEAQNVPLPDDDDDDDIIDDFEDEDLSDSAEMRKYIEVCFFMITLNENDSKH